LLFGQFKNPSENIQAHNKLEGGTNGEESVTLGGGGPAAGLHIGVLEALATAGITFDVWALSCIGAWVGIVYNQFDGEKVRDKDRAEQTYQFFKNGVFRDDESYERFPINTVFGPDWGSIRKALSNFDRDSDNYKDFVWDPYKMMESFQDSMSILFDQLPDRDKERKFKKLDEGDINKMDSQSGDGAQSLRPLFDVHDVSVERHRPVQDQLSG